MAAKDIEKAVHATQLYFGCADKVHVEQAQRLYARMNRSIASVARKRNMNVLDAHEQISAEARRRGAICPMPGKDI